MTTEEMYYGHEVSEQHEARDKAAALEALGWRVWLCTVFPHIFTDNFSEHHAKYWELLWEVIFTIKRGEKPDAKKLKRLVIWGRGLGKSTTGEAAAVMRGAILGGGYCLYVCETQDQANEHISNCLDLVQNSESKLGEYYPEMVNTTRRTLNKTSKVKQTEQLFICGNGWICRAKGLDARMRGLRIGGRRPDDIKIDDIDEVNDSVALSLKKLKKLTASVFPTQANTPTTIDFLQNLITETSVMNLIYTGKSDALSNRTTLGVAKTFEKFEFDTILDEQTGHVRHIIRPTSIPTWAFVNIEKAQEFLDDSGLDTFLAEYQNEFDHLKTDKVFHEYNEERHVITWGQFEKVFGCRYIPESWAGVVGSDIGYSKKSLSAWAFVSTSSRTSPLPKHYFLGKGRTFCEQSIDDQAIALWESFFPDYQKGKRHYEATQKFANYPELFRVLNTNPKISPFLQDFQYDAATNKYIERVPVDEADITRFYLNQAKKSFRSQYGEWRISHEKTGEQKTLAQKYGLPIEKTKHFGKVDGVTEANHLLRGDYTKPHPFKPDEKVLNEEGDWTGLYRLGKPFFYFVVEDLQLAKPTDDAGLKTFREQIAGQRWVEEEIGRTGLSERVPMKLESDCCDAIRMVTVEYTTAFSRDATPAEKRELSLPKILREEEIAKDLDKLPPEEIGGRQIKRELVLKFEQPLKNKMGGGGEKKKDYWGDKF